MSLLQGPTLPTIGTVRGFWDSPKVPGLSQTFGSLRLRNKPNGVGTLGLWDNPNVPRLSCGCKGLRTRFGGIWGKILKSSHVTTEKYWSLAMLLLKNSTFGPKTCWGSSWFLQKIASSDLRGLKQDFFSINIEKMHSEVSNLTLNLFQTCLS